MGPICLQIAVYSHPDHSEGSWKASTSIRRCKRLHPILALAFKIQHFNAVLSNFRREDELREMLNELDAVSPEASEAFLESSNVLKECMESY